MRNKSSYSVGSHHNATTMSDRLNNACPFSRSAKKAPAYHPPGTPTSVLAHNFTPVNGDQWVSFNENGTVLNAASANQAHAGSPFLYPGKDSHGLFSQIHWYPLNYLF